MYGNPYSLEKIQEIARKERSYPTLFFNGDFNFFNVTDEYWHEINTFIKDNAFAIKGNIEDVVSTPFENNSYEFDCGCDYPSYVDREYANRSNEIARALHKVAERGDREIIRWLQSLPMFSRVKFQDLTIGILHGDAHNLSGWRFAPENIVFSEKGGRIFADNPTTLPEIGMWLAEAGCDVFACTHTCCPIALTTEFSEVSSVTRKGVVINNGSAGIPNFTGIQQGLITRIATDSKELCPQMKSIYTYKGFQGIRIDAISVPFDNAKWVETFLSWWPPETPAYKNYFQRICGRTDYSIEQACRGDFSLFSH